MRPRIVIAYDGTPAADDGLVLGRILADLRGADLLVARVFSDIPPEVSDRAVQADTRARLEETRAAAADFLGDRAFELWPVYGLSVPDGIDRLADQRSAELVVFGSAHHGRIGRALLGDAAAAACGGAPAAVAIAPHGYRRRARLSPPVIGVAYDGSAESASALDTGVALAHDAGATLRVIAVEPAGLSHPIGHLEPVAEDLERLPLALAGDVHVETQRLRGDPAHALARESERLGLLVCGSRARGPLRRVLLGSVSGALVRSADCPLLVVPRRVLHPVADAPLAALSHS
jgi:nucleotide-binding universal stress UspA family protein